MKTYLLTIYQPDGPAPAPEALGPVMQRIEALRREMKAANAWVFSGGLHPPSSATVVRLRDGDVLTTDGPYVESKEHAGGFWLVRAPDLDAALEWARKAGRALSPDGRQGLPIEVRPLQHAEGA